jgi:hypothetical protein
MMPIAVWSEDQSLKDEARAGAAAAPSGGAIGHHTVKRQRIRSTGVN